MGNLNIITMKIIILLVALLFFVCLFILKNKKQIDVVYESNEIEKAIRCTQESKQVIADSRAFSMYCSEMQYRESISNNEYNNKMLLPMYLVILEWDCLYIIYDPATAKYASGDKLEILNKEYQTWKEANK